MDIILSYSSGVPIYQQIKNQIKKCILEEELAEGSSLPSIRQLAKDLQISVITTKRAYEELEKEGLIESVVGKGSYVSGENRELIKEKRLKQWEEKMEEVVRDGKGLNLSLDEIIENLKMFYEEGKS